MVLALTEEIAAWCSKPYAYDHAGNTYRPVVIGPSGIPRITKIEEAKALPKLAVLSVAAHGHDEGAEEIGIAAYVACATLDRERGALYTDGIMAWLNQRSRQETFMLIHGYEFHSDFAKKYAADGFRQAIQTLYETRFGAVPPALEEALARVHYGDELRRLVAVVGAGSPEEIAAAVRAAAG